MSAVAVDPKVDYPHGTVVKIADPGLGRNLYWIRGEGEDRWLPTHATAMFNDYQTRHLTNAEIVFTPPPPPKPPIALGNVLRSEEAYANAPIGTVLRFHTSSIWFKTKFGWVAEKNVDTRHEPDADLAGVPRTVVYLP